MTENNSLQKQDLVRRAERPLPLRWLRLAAAAMATVLAIWSSAQINYSQPFDTDLGWSLNSGTIGTTDACTGNALRRALAPGFLGTTVWTVSSPSLGVANGLSASYSFVYRLQTNNNGSPAVRSRWKSGAGGSWTTTTHTIPANNTCVTFTVPFTPTAGQEIYVELETQKSYSLTSNSRWFVFDTFTLTQAALPVCSGAPAPGNTTGPSSVICNTINLGVQNTPTIDGLSYSWESGPSGSGPWTPVGNTTTSLSVSPTTTTWYQCVATCSFSGQSTPSTPKQVSVVAPNPGNTTGPASVTLGQNIALALQTASGAGVTYQWQRSINGVDGWVDFGTSTATQNTTQDYATWYRCIVTCPATGLIGTSNPLQVTMTYPHLCYYTFEMIDSYGDGWNSGVMQLRAGTTVIQTFSGPPNEGNVGGNSQTISVGLTPGTSYNVYWSAEGSFPEEMGIRVRNQDGTQVYYFAPTSSYGTVPRALYTWTPSCPAPVVCTGTPTPGNTTGPATSCAGNPFTLGVQAAPTGAGVAYEWQSSPTGGAPWTTIATTSTGTYNVGNYHDQAFFYRAIVTCTASSLSATSNPLQIGVDATPTFPQDLSSATFPPGCWTREGPDAANLTRQSPNAFGQPGTGSMRYRFWASSSRNMTFLSPVFQPTPAGSLIALDVAGRGYDPSFTDRVFVEASTNNGTSWTLVQEMTNAIGGQLNTAGSLTTEFTAPTAAQWAHYEFALPTGTNRVRFRGVGSPCSGFFCPDLGTNAGNNVFFDNIRVREVCTGSPDGGTASIVGAPVGCYGQSLTLTSNADNSAVVGVEYEWEVNYSDPEEDFSWEPLFDGDGLNTTTYTTAPLDEYDKYYRLKATCSATSDVSYSTYVFVPMFEPPVVSLVSNPANALICSSGSVELSVTGSDIDQYLWSPGTNLTPNVNASTVMVSPPSTRSYSVTATNASGCTATEGITVRVELNPTATTTASPTTICEDGTVVLTTVAAPVPAIDYSNPVVRSANSNSINLAIPDATNELFSTTPGAVVNSALSVSGGPYAPQAITVHISTTHPANSDLEFWLQGPANCGTMEISTRNGGNIGNYSNARFTAPAGVLPSPPVGSTNMSGSYRAEGNLSTGINIPGVGNPGPLSGCPVNGTWTLYMRDVAAPFLGSSAGTLTNWQIHISEPGSGNYTHTVTGGTGVGTASSTVYSGTSNSTGQIIMSNITPGVNRSFIVTTTAPSGCTTTSSTGANITIHPLPVVTCPGPSSICVLDAAYTLEGGLPVDGTYSGNGVSAGMFDPAAAGPGVHTITYSYTNVNNCTNTCSFDITVIPDTDGDGLCAPEDDCPTVPGQVGSTCDANPGPGFTLGQLNGSCNCIGVTCTTDLSLDITMPTAGLLPVWELRDRTNDVLVQSGGGTFGNGGTPNQQLTCLPDGRFYLVITGMPAGGRYVLRTAGNPGIRLIDNRVAAGGGNQVVEFTNSPAALSSNGPVQLPVGPTELLFTSCDKYFWKKGEFIVVNEDADVAAVWVPSGSNAVQSSTTGYDFWFYDPNGGYSFIRQRRHNVSDGFGNVGSSRTCHMQVNNWAAANWIPSQQRLNVRVRAVVNNVPKNWGPACRFVLDETLALCPPTWLMDVPGNPFISCNVTRAYNTQSINRIYARPVTGATKYRFSFNNAELSTPIVREVTTYYLTLGWGGGTAPILQNGQTYDVTVQAFVNGAYCVVGQTCSVTICNNPPCNQFNGGQQNSAIDTPVSNASLNMWPNPNRGDQLFISISAIEEGVTTVSMDLFDLSGKRMVARTIATQGGNLNTVVDLNGDLAAGMYLVQFTAGDRTYTQRLVIQP